MNAESRAMSYGVGTYTKQLISSLKTAGFHITIVTLYAGIRGGELSVFLKDSVRYINIPKPSKDGYEQLFFSEEDNTYQKNAYYVLLSFIPVNEEIFFHFNFMELSNIASCLKKNGKHKIILTVHYTFWSFALTGDINKLNKILLQPENMWESEIQRSFLNEKFFVNEIADYVIAIANHSLIMLNTLYGVDFSKITLIPNGLEDSYKERTIEEKGNIRKRFHLRENEKILLFVGRLTSVKGVGEMIEAFKLAVEQTPEIRLIIAGDGVEKEMKDYFKQCYPIWSKINFTGFISRDVIFELYAIADAGIVPSIHEEFGYVAVEMMMAGLPVIANQSTGLKEIIEENESGEFVLLERESLESSQLFAKKIVDLLQDAVLLKKYAQNGRMIFKERFSLSSFGEKISSFYHNVSMDQIKNKKTERSL